MSMLLSERSPGKIKCTEIEAGNLSQNGVKFSRNLKADSNVVVQAATSRELNDSTPELKSTNMTAGDAFLASAKSKTSSSLMPHASSHSISKNGRGVLASRDKVLNVLKEFKELFAQLLEEWGSKPIEERKGICRADLQAARILRDKGKWINCDVSTGKVPGVEIGDHFQYRAELAIIGLHREQMNGIHYDKVDGKNYATSIVDSGRYNNKTLSDDEFIYLGEGGNPEVSSGLKDQTLKGGNLALKNSMDSGIRVRVIRGSQTLGASNTMAINRRSGFTFVYVGLFQVTKCTYCDYPRFGHKVFQFTMKRMTDDPNLTHQTSSVPGISTIQRKQDVIGDMNCQKEMLNSAVKNVKTSKFIYSSTSNGCGGNRCSSSRFRNKDDSVDYGAVAHMAMPLISNRRANGANPKLKLG